MTIKDRANDFIGHPPEVDEGYETSMRRNAYIKGFEDAVNFFKHHLIICKGMDVKCVVLIKRGRSAERRKKKNNGED